MPPRKSLALFAALIAWMAACTPEPQNTPAPAPYLVTATLLPTPSPRPSALPPSPILTPSAAPVEGMTITQVNVRSEPSTAGALLGMLPLSTRVQVLGKDSSGNWYQILYPAASDGKGWIASQYVQVPDKDAVPLLAPASASEPSGVITQQVNIRSGPASAFASLGILNPNDIVTLTGRDESGLWLRIRVPSAPESHGWVAAAYVQTDALESLPIISSGGEVKGTATPTLVPPTLTPTLVAAQDDRDSPQSPAVNLAFSPRGAGALLYSSDLSAPTGDAEDWVQFTPYTSIVRLGLLCEGNGTLKAEIRPEAAPLNGANLQCNKSGTWRLAAGQTYTVRLQAVAREEGLQYVRYTLSIETVR